MPRDVSLPDVALSLALAVVSASTAPLLLLDGDCRVIAASDSFGEAFGLNAHILPGALIFAMGDGEWDVPRLRSLLKNTASGAAEVGAYEIDLKLPVRGKRRLVLNAHRLDYLDPVYGATGVRLLLAVADVTDARLRDQVRDDLLREKKVLMQEIEHRVANSLQIIASVLLQSARKVGSDETRLHLRDAHSRVMAIAELHSQLAESDIGDVAIGTYLAELCLSLGASMIDDHDRISIVTRSDASRVTANASVSIGLVVTELVINSLKHAFPGDRKGHILVDYVGSGNGWTLKVSDDGIGMQGEADVSAGLGTNIISALARHLGADVTVSDGRPGTHVALIHKANATANPEVAL
ncbi:MAG: sensor histidine kinase [Polymorphobacter sp.]